MKAEKCYYFEATVPGLNPATQFLSFVVGSTIFHPMFDNRSRPGQDFWSLSQFLDVLDLRQGPGLNSTPSLLFQLGKFSMQNMFIIFFVPDFEGLMKKIL